MSILGERARIGLILPSVNTVAEPEMNSIRPHGVTVHAARMTVPSDISNLEAFVRMCEAGCQNAEKAVLELKTAKVDVYAFAFTAGSFFKGAGWDDEIARRIEEVGGAPCVVTSAAAVDALNSFGVKRISIASPYAVGNELLKRYMNEKGFEVVKIEGLALVSVQEEGRQGIQTFRRLVKNVNALSAEAIFVSCTNFATLATLDGVERFLGKLIITANQATFWAALRRAGINEKIEGFGRLFREK